MPDTKKIMKKAAKKAVLGGIAKKDMSRGAWVTSKGEAKAVIGPGGRDIPLPESKWPIYVQKGGGLIARRVK